MAGTAPGVGEFHFAFPSDCFPRCADDTSVTIMPEERPQHWAAECNVLAEEWRVLARAYESGDRTGRARWVSGCPARAARSGVGGNRLLLMVPEPITFELLSEVTANLRNVRLGRLSEVDDLGDPQESLALALEARWSFTRPRAGHSVWSIRGSHRVLRWSAKSNLQARVVFRRRGQRRYCS